jgi:hypothetical protein
VSRASAELLVGGWSWENFNARVVRSTAILSRDYYIISYNPKSPDVVPITWRLDVANKGAQRTESLVPELPLELASVISLTRLAVSTHPQGSYRGHVQAVADPKGEPPPDLIRLNLRKILSSELFARSSRHSRFLRFTVEETLEGRGCDLKQYVLGLEVFDRTESFDPQSDPIVRVGATRVRAKLKAYYDTEGQEDSVLIEFPSGYRPVFRWRQETPKNGQSIWRRVTNAFMTLITGVLLAVRTAKYKLI